MSANPETSLPGGDRTPSNYQLPKSNWQELIKQPIRRWLYPILNGINHRTLDARYSTAEFRPDLWLMGQRGNDYERHRRRVNKLFPLKDRDILIAGCGTGRDIESWLSFNPKRVYGYDLFSYNRAWNNWKTKFRKISPQVEVEFRQGDLARLNDASNASYDVIASDAVFEHICNLPEVIHEFNRILRPGGILYATFGPLWYSWGGDHVSGYDKLENGYNHLILDKAQWMKYLEGMGEYQHSEHDGRTWIEHDLFSRLRPIEYLRIIEKENLQRCFVGAIIDPRGITCLDNSDLRKQLQENYSILDLLVTGMTVLYRKTHD